MGPTAVQSYLKLGSAYSTNYHSIYGRLHFPLGLESASLGMQFICTFLVYFLALGILGGFLAVGVLGGFRHFYGWSVGSLNVGLCLGFEFSYIKICIFAMLFTIISQGEK